MERPLYTVCPRCGRRARITRTARDWETEETIAFVKCECGTSHTAYSGNRILKIDLDNPFMQEQHFDLLVPPGWTQDMWEKISAGIPDW